MAREAVASAIANTFSTKGAGGRTPPAPGRSPTKPT
jgi:hypothetical protein